MIVKKIVNMIIIAICFSSASLSAAPVSVDMTSGVWVITASDTGGNDWSGSQLTFETQTLNNNDWSLTGYFDWISDTGFFGRENFTGTLYEDRSLQLNGFELVPPTNNIIVGQYFAELGLSNNNIVNGTWEANVPFIPTNGWTASRAVVPVPAAAWLFGTGLIGLIGMAKRKRT